VCARFLLERRTVKFTYAPCTEKNAFRVRRRPFFLFGDWQRFNGHIRSVPIRRSSTGGVPRNANDRYLKTDPGDFFDFPRQLCRCIWRGGEGRYPIFVRMVKARRWRTRREYDWYSPRRVRTPVDEVFRSFRRHGTECRTNAMFTFRKTNKPRSPLAINLYNCYHAPLTRV